MWKISILYGIFNSRLGGILSGIRFWEGSPCTSWRLKNGQKRRPGDHYRVSGVLSLQSFRYAQIIFSFLCGGFIKVTEGENMTVTLCDDHMGGSSRTSGSRYAAWSL